MFPFHFGSRTCICMVQFLFSLPPSLTWFVCSCLSFRDLSRFTNLCYPVSAVPSAPAMDLQGQCHCISTMTTVWTRGTFVIIYVRLATDHIEHQLHMFNLGVSTLFPNVFLTLSCVFIWFIWLITLFSAIWHTLWIEESIIISDPDLNGSLSRAVHAYDGNELTLWIPEFSDESPQLSFYLTGVFFRSFSLQQLCWFFP